MNAPQRTEAWFAARAGRITASRIGDVMAFEPDSVYKTGPRAGQFKSGVRKARLDYINQLAAERITGNAKNQISAPALEWGKEWEPAAREAYEETTGILAIECEFVVHPEFDFIGASADFLVGADGGGEIKCPQNQEVHLETLETGLPLEHIDQIQAGLWCTGRKWWDFVSFHPHFPRGHHIYIQRVMRDDAYIAQMRDACLSLEAEVCKIVDKYLPPRGIAQ